MTQGLSPFLRRIRRFALCLAALFMLTTAVAPQQAQAGDCLYYDMICYVFRVPDWIVQIYAWIKEKAMAAWDYIVKSQVIEVLTEFWELVKKLFAELMDTTSKTAATEVGFARMASKSADRAMQAEVDLMYRSELSSLIAAIGRTPTAPTHQGACKKVIAGAAPVKAQPIADSLAGEILDGLNESGRGQVKNAGGQAVPEDGAGPQEAARRYANDCTLKVLSPVDGAPQECISAPPSDPMLPSFADASILPPVLGVPMTAALTETKEAGIKKANVMDPQTDQERLFAAKVAWLDRVKGTTPPLAQFAALDTPVGVTQRAMAAHCKALENGLVMQCARSIAFQTAPNCTKDPGTCEAQKAQCHAATGGYINAAAYQNCEAGMSAYQALMLEHAGCLSVGQVINAAQQGPAAAAGSSNRCAWAWFELQALVEQKQLNCRKAVAAMVEVDGCWKEVERLGRGGNFASREAQQKEHTATVWPGEGAPLHHQVVYESSPLVSPRTGQEGRAP